MLKAVRSIDVCVSSVEVKLSMSSIGVLSAVVVVSIVVVVEVLGLLALLVVLLFGLSLLVFLLLVVVFFWVFLCVMVMKESLVTLVESVAVVLVVGMGLVGVTGTGLLATMVGVLGVLASLSAWASAGVGLVWRLASLAAFWRRVWRLVGGAAGVLAIMVVAWGRWWRRKDGKKLEGLREVGEAGARVRRSDMCFGRCRLR